MVPSGVENNNGNAKLKLLKMQDPDKQKLICYSSNKTIIAFNWRNPRLIDEWQMAPVLWDAVRTAVDER